MYQLPDVCTESELFEAKVPIAFLGTVGFSLRRKGRYSFGYSIPFFYYCVKVTS
jgi:hypothetical protein